MEQKSDEEKIVRVRDRKIKCRTFGCGPACSCRLVCICVIKACLMLRGQKGRKMKRGPLMVKEQQQSITKGRKGDV